MSSGSVRAEAKMRSGSSAQRVVTRIPIGSPSNDWNGSPPLELSARESRETWSRSE